MVEPKSNDVADSKSPDTDKLLDMFSDSDIQFELKRPIPNIVRAAMLAEQHSHSQDKVRYVQESALKQYCFKYENLIGARRLWHEYGFSEADLMRILGIEMANKLIEKKRQ